METVRKYQGKGNFDTLVRRIYTKYVYKGENAEYFDNTIEGQIEDASTKEELEEIENIVIARYYEGIISPEEYDYLMERIERRRNDLL